jgi:heat-inducible transcriptional repressor
MAGPRASLELSTRQREILARLVESYVATGSPVGSKTLVEQAGVEASSSTVRYELAVLEERGLLMHPHTSAGRVPTDAGYRFYVDRVLERLEPRPTAELGLNLPEAQSHVEEALRATTDALAQVTHLLALVSAPSLETTSVRRVEVILLQPQLVMVVVITSTGGVSKRLFAFAEPVDPGLAEWAGEYLNEQVAGLLLGARLLRARFEDPELAPGERAFLAELAPAFTELVEAGEQSLYVGGAAGLLDEFREEDLHGYRRLLEVLERRAELLELMRANLGSKSPFVRVGSEFGDPDLQSISLVAAPYGLRHRNLGTVSLLGPIRMDYVRAIEVVRSAAHELSLFVEDIYDE